MTKRFLACLFAFAALLGVARPASASMTGIGKGVGVNSVQWDLKKLGGVVSLYDARRGLGLISTTVSTWADQSGLGNTLGAISTGNNPTVSTTGGPLATLPAVVFASASTQQMGNATANPLASGSTVTMIGVFKPAAVSTELHVYTIGRNTSGNFLGMALTVAGSAASKRNLEIIGTAFGADNTSNATTSWEFWEGTNSSNAQTFSVNNAAHTLSPNTSTFHAPSACVMVGGSDCVATPAQTFNGSIFLLAAWARLLSSAENAKVASYISSVTQIF